MNQLSAYDTLSTIKSILDVDVPLLLDDIQSTNPTIDFTTINAKLDECNTHLLTLESATYTLEENFPISLNEQLTDQRWIDGKPIYQKTINFGALPNATTKSVSHALTGIEIYFLDQSLSFVIDGSSSARYLPAFASPSALTSSWTSWVTSTSVVMMTGSNRSGMSAYLTIKYTKTTDTAQTPVLERGIV